MFEGLRIARDKSYWKIEIESDNALLVELLLPGGGATSNIVELCLLHQLIHRLWQIRLKHIKRDQKGMADHLAKCAASGDSLLQLFAVPPMSVRPLLDKDQHDARNA